MLKSWKFWEGSKKKRKEVRENQSEAPTWKIKFKNFNAKILLVKRIFREQLESFDDIPRLLTKLFLEHLNIQIEISKFENHNSYDDVFSEQYKYFFKGSFINLDPDFVLTRTDYQKIITQVLALIAFCAGKWMPILMLMLDC